MLFGFGKFELGGNFGAEKVFLCGDGGTEFSGGVALGGNAGGTTAVGEEVLLWGGSCFECFGDAELGGNADGFGGVVLGGNAGDTTGAKEVLSCGDFEQGGDAGGTRAGGEEECLWCDLCFECLGDAEVGGNADGSGGEEVIPCDGGIAGAIVGGISVSGGEGNGAKWSGDEVNGGNEGSLGLGKGGISCECDNWFMD
ncbi:hypothetical protein Pint_13732 [Pistacia integerrima]|uniref:Uncharacterized protein n=1 Tax=Pistacia integerrima TaxID=434235 RepID=A0ACC0Y7Z4_9ROSI|nr:hypothetical protein Pint_13732 [Pistacia integerrima]